jgi:putative flippase GtrA
MTRCFRRSSIADPVHALINKLLLYVVTGGIAATIDAGGFALLIHSKMNIVPASFISFGVAALVNYRLTSQFVFGREATLRDFGHFLFAALIGLAVNVSVTLAGVNLFEMTPLTAKFAGIGLAFFVNFSLNYGVVFGAKRDTL